MNLRLHKFARLAGLLGLVASVGCNSAGSAAYSNGGAATLATGRESVVDGATVARCIVGIDDEILSQRVLSLINIERATVGVSPVTLNDELVNAAESYACTLAGEDFFDHIHPATGEGPGERAAAAGYVYFAVGENLAAGQISAAQVVESWMESKGHRQNLLSPDWKETGIGVRRGGTYGVYWVQLFGKPATLRTEVIMDDASLTIVRE